MKRGIVQSPGFPLGDKSQWPANVFAFQAGIVPRTCGRVAIPGGLGQEGPGAGVVSKPKYLSPRQAHGQTFTFPDLFPEKEQSPDGSPSGDDIQDKLLEEQRQRQRQDPRRGGVPSWFGL